MKVIGFTGTQHGMSDSQRERLKWLLATELTDDPMRDVHLHHGDCIGADADADSIAWNLGCRIVIHPPTDAKKRAFCDSGRTIILKEKPYLERNHDIVDETEYLIAAPRDPYREEMRSGTWATIRYARKMDKKVVILGA